MTLEMPDYLPTEIFAASAPARIRLSRRKGYRKPQGAVVVSRPSRWGNDWKVTPWTTDDGDDLWSVWNVRTGATRSQHETKADAIRAAVRYFRADVEDAVPGMDFSELAGRDLACWCPLDQPCHADILLSLANGGPMLRALIFDQDHRRISGTGRLIRLGDGSIDIAMNHPIRIDYFRRDAG